MKPIPVLYYAVTATDRLTDVRFLDLLGAWHFAFYEQMRLERLQHGRLKYYHSSSPSLQRATDKLLPVVEEEIKFYEEAYYSLDQYMNTRPERACASDDDLPF